MNVLDLFSGIGGFSLGLERAGMRTVAFCEIDPYCRAVLRKHWPAVPIFEDVRTLTAETLADAAGELSGAGRSERPKAWEEVAAHGIDVICGGFPCQDISVAGKGAGIDGERSGLWSEYARLVGEIRPRFVIVENVAALLGRGIERVLGDLAALGYDAEWHCIPASAVGAPHRRDRIWILAYPNSFGCREQDVFGQQSWGAEIIGASENTHPTHYAAIGEGIRRGDAAGQWWVEPDVGRVAHGVPARVDRLRSLGNAVVPQIPEIIGRAIMSMQR